ncbi:MAG: adenylate/guanylate cyclase domain-containing protein [Planctomycetota bacterium]
MKLPDLVIKYICRDTIQGRRVAFLEVDKKGLLVARGGAIADYVPTKLITGADVGAQVDFLAGMLPLDDEPQLLLAIEVAPGSFADAHLVPGETSDWVLLFDASERAAVDQLLQQRSNEVRLLSERLDRERRDKGSVDEIKSSLDFERRKARHLLSNLLPAGAIERLQRGERDIVDEIAEVAIVQVAVDDFVGATRSLAPRDRARLLGEIFAVVEDAASRLDATFLKTLGASCLIGVGVDRQVSDPVVVGAELALDIRSRFEHVTAGEGEIPIALRVALTAGPVTAGIVGFERFGFEVWGSCVGEAGWLTRLAGGGQILASSGLASRLEARFDLGGVGREDALEIVAVR